MKNHFELTIFTHQDVFGLEIAIKDLLGVKLAQAESYLGSEKLRLLLSEPLYLHKVLEKLATLDKLHDEVNAELILEDVLHAHEERMVV